MAPRWRPAVGAPAEADDPGAGATNTQAASTAVIHATSATPHRFGYLAGGDYRLASDRTFARSPYAAEYYRNVTEERGLAASDVIAVPAGGDVDAFSSLATGGAISGRLLDHNGDPPVGSCQVRVDAPA